MAPPPLPATNFRSRVGQVAQAQPPTNPAGGLPGVYFRILYVTPEGGRHARPEYRLAVEVGLGPWVLFQGGHAGRLERLVPADRLVSAVPPPRGRYRPPEPPRPPREPRLPPVVETLRKALAWRQELDTGAVACQADIARREGLTRARVTQVLILLRLCPDIQNAILAIRESPRPPAIGENVLRPIACLGSRRRQLAAFGARVGQDSAAKP